MNKKKRCRFKEINLGEAQDRGLVESHPDKGGRENLGVHLAPVPHRINFAFNLIWLFFNQPGARQIISLPRLHVRACFS